MFGRREQRNILSAVVWLGQVRWGCGGNVLQVRVAYYTSPLSWECVHFVTKSKLGDVNLVVVVIFVIFLAVARIAYYM